MNGGIIAEHYTRFPVGASPVAETNDRWNDRDTKYKLVVHAEAGSVFDAVRKGKSPVGGTMYACWAACTDCARAIIESGVRRLIAHSPPQHRERADWHKSIEFADQMMKEAGVEIIRIEEHLGKQIRFAGRTIEV